MITIKTTIKELKKALNGKTYIYDDNQVGEIVDGYVGKKPVFYLRKFSPITFENTLTMEVDGTSARRAASRLTEDENTPVTITSDPEGIWIETKREMVFVYEIDYDNTDYFNPMRRYRVKTLQS